MAKEQSIEVFQSLRKDAFRALEEVFNAKDVGAIEAEYLGKNGRLTNILKSLKNMPEIERKQMGGMANALKKEIEGKIKIKKSEFKDKDTKKDQWIDTSLPGKRIMRGHLHPISRVLKDASAIFESMGFDAIDGPEVETEYYNFDALNIPGNHPARDLWDTFWLKNGMLLRTHTSPNQIRYMEKHQPPFRVVAPGRCFRYEATDATHEIQFYQLEGFMVGEQTSLADLKGVAEVFFKKFFSAQSEGDDLKVRFRPSYFPFVEPGVEIDICFGKENKWLEIAGAGMIHPQVFKNVKLNPGQWQGFAFGMGIDRLAMIKYKIDDIRLFYSGDLRVINQF